MKVLIVSSEAAPYFKTGGLGDVAGALPVALARLGHDARLVMPRYRFIDVKGFALEPLLAEIGVEVDGRVHATSIDALGARGVDGPQSVEPAFATAAAAAEAAATTAPPAAPARAPTYFVRCDRYFDRDYPYYEVVAGELRDYPDNLERFGVFCMATLWMLKALGWRPDVIHCNDWQTALIPVYLRVNPLLAADPFYREIRTVFSIHNLAFQAIAPAAMLPRIGGAPDAFSIPALDFGARSGGGGGGSVINLMQGAILSADAITTVSHRYAREIQAPELGCGLDGLLREQAAKLTGIVNGIDDETWNPATDRLLPATYSVDDLTGKAACKRALQAEFGLPQRADAPLIGMVSRLSAQKGFELVDAALTGIVERGGQLVMLGSGEPRYHRMLDRMRRKYRDAVGARLGFDDPLSHRVIAGADLFLMPSFYEPCGLNQMFAMRYGTPPIVRATGGLADTVVNCSPATLERGEASGFVFHEFTPRALLGAVSRAFELYRAQSVVESGETGAREGLPADGWHRLMLAAMARDFSWRAAAREYEALYRRTLQSPPPPQFVS